MFEFQVTNEHVQQLDLYNKSDLPESEKAGIRLLKYFRKHKKEVFPNERNEYLTPFVKFFDDNTLLSEKTHPRTIAQMAMQMADFRISNAKEGYLSESQLSRCVQKLRITLYGE
ncbi:hypothetical protein [uncultured Bacteroides sp.]|uniref:hypothetical protein n=1 Tax=uncultured Bacteroides sp. TaxID=162156 RepID=UPI00280AA884|nr:hypothetical protein [uncultured Bacteroides sp.]